VRRRGRNSKERAVMYLPFEDSTKGHAGRLGKGRLGRSIRYHLKECHEKPVSSPARTIGIGIIMDEFILDEPTEIRAYNLTLLLKNLHPEIDCGLVYEILVEFLILSDNEFIEPDEIEATAQTILETVGADTRPN
jgi:hypothetical protein